MGSSKDGLLGLGPTITKTLEPKELKIKDGNAKLPIQSISVGARHAVAVMQNGTAYSWGVNTNGRLGVGESDKVQIEWAPLLLPQTEGVALACAGLDCTALVTHGGLVMSCGRQSGRLGHGGEVRADVSLPKPMFGGLQLWRRNGHSCAQG